MPNTLRNRKYYDQVVIGDELHKRSLNGDNFNQLMKYVVSDENILMAYRNIKRNGGSETPGVDGKTIKDIENMTQEEFIKKIRNKLTYYKPKPVKRIEIPKNGDPTRIRPLGIPCIMDRIVQQCIKQVIEPIAEAKFYENSFGFRPNRSAENAFAICSHTATFAILHYVVDIDIKGFFDNVNHRKLLQQLWTMGIHDKKLLAIIKEMLKAPIVLPNFKKIIPEKGTPQGGILSPLLANIYLNELDWWIASQWTDFPSRHTYTTKTAMHQVLSKTSNLKNMRIVRYADDFKIFCRDKDTAKRCYCATAQWLKERLKLEISPDKSGITNLRKSYTDFLGYEFKVQRKPEIKKVSKKGIILKPWVVTSRIKRSTLIQMQENLFKLIRKIEFPEDSNKQAQYIRLYNSTILGYHNYYCHVSQARKDFAKLQRLVNRRFFNRVECISSVKPDDATILSVIDKHYGKSSQMKYVNQLPIIPVGYIQYATPTLPNRKVNEYTEEGRTFKMTKENTGCSVNLLQELMRQKCYGSVEYCDNRISLFSAQKGKCAITGSELKIHEIHCHHIIPRKYGGSDRYDNLIIVNERIHVLIHATNKELIGEIINCYNLKSKQMEIVNELREKLNLFKIDLKIYKKTIVR